MKRMVTYLMALYSSKLTWTGVENMVYLAWAMMVNSRVRKRDLRFSNPGVGEKDMFRSVFK